MSEQIEDLADRVDRLGIGATIALVLQSIIDRQFLLQGDRATGRMFNLAREHWSRIEPVLTLMGYKPVLRPDIGVIGFQLKPLVDAKTGETTPPPRERRLDVRTSCLLLTLRQLYHVRRESGQSDVDSNPEDVLVTSDEIEGAIAEVSPKRSFASPAQLRNVLKDMEYHGLVAVEDPVDDGAYLVRIRPTITLTLTKEQIPLIRNYVPASLMQDSGNQEAV